MPALMRGGRLNKTQDLANELANERALRIRAEEANRVKDEFLGTLSHELRTPLNAITGWAHILQAGTLAPAEQARALDTILRNAQLQARLIEDLLDVSRIISGKLHLDLAPLDLHQVVDAAVQAATPAAEAKQLHLTVECASAAPDVSGDASRLLQVLGNLLHNSIKFCEPGGNITVRTQVSKRSVQLTVTDDGRGIAPEFLPLLFERFRQAGHPLARARGGGLGLGLAIARYLVEAHHGTIEAHSEGEGTGATFTITLPLQRSDAPASSPPPAAPTPTRQLCGAYVLVVDDDPDARDLLSVLLGREGAEVGLAASGAEARALIRVRHPDVIVCDVGMPEQDGHSFLRQLRASGEQAGTVVSRRSAGGYAAAARQPGETLAKRDNAKLMIDSKQTESAWLVERTKTGVPGLDALLRGGFVRGAIYLVMGRPGTGKTTLGNQLCFEHVKQGGRAAYMTLLAESHAAMLKNLHSMAFFDANLINNGLSYVGAYRALRDEKLRGLLEMVRRVIMDEKASLLIIDGISPARALADSDVALKEFVIELQMLGAMTNCTTILLANMTAQDANDPEHTMVDGLIELAFEQHRRRTLRTIEVLKFRGTRHLLGRHELQVSNEGVSIHPRLEDLVDGSAHPAGGSDQRLHTGVRELDTMLRGGLLRGTTSVALGFSGSGKTSLAMHFLNAGAEAGEPGVLFGFYESPERLLQGADHIGLPLRQYASEGQYSHVWQPSYEFGLDQLGARLFSEIERIGAKRVVIDSLDGFRQAAFDPARTIRFMTALLGELRVRNITTILTDETMKPSGPEMEMRVEGISALVENLFLLEYMTIGPKLRRLISIVKQRASMHETNAREFFLTGRGIEIAPDARSAAEVVAHSDEFSARHADQPQTPEGV